MPQLVEKGQYYTTITKWLETHPEATLKDLRSEFYLSPGTMKMYLKKWRERYRHKYLKEIILFMYKIMSEKMKREYQLTMEEKKQMLVVENYVHIFKKELGIKEEQPEWVSK